MLICKLFSLLLRLNKIIIKTMRENLTLLFFFHLLLPYVKHIFPFNFYINICGTGDKETLACCTKNYMPVIAGSHGHQNANLQWSSIQFVSKYIFLYMYQIWLFNENRFVMLLCQKSKLVD